MRISDSISFTSTTLLVVGILTIGYSFYVTKGKMFPWRHSELNRRIMIVGIVVLCVGQLLKNVLWLISNFS